MEKKKANQTIKKNDWGHHIEHLKRHDANPNVVAVLDQIRVRRRNPLIHPSHSLRTAEAVVLYGICVGAIEEIGWEIKELNPKDWDAKVEAAQQAIPPAEISIDVQDPENTEGRENPGAEARRLHEESAQADGSQETQEAVSYLPSEEVASETSNDVRSAGCTAKRTRSGSLEDA
ncbi:MAG: hypothetical protein IH849_06215 [Acidobacteria bacterium]|nr:hypothetical protein [Acidobacteriota bacterium]